MSNNKEKQPPIIELDDNKPENLEQLFEEMVASQMQLEEEKKRLAEYMADQRLREGQIEAAISDYEAGIKGLVEKANKANELLNEAEAIISGKTDISPAMMSGIDKFRQIVKDAWDKIEEIEEETATVRRELALKKEDLPPDGKENVSGSIKEVAGAKYPLIQAKENVKKSETEIVEIAKAIVDLWRDDNGENLSLGKEQNRVRYQIKINHARQKQEEIKQKITDLSQQLESLKDKWFKDEKRSQIQKQVEELKNQQQILEEEINNIYERQKEAFDGYHKLENDLKEKTRQYYRQYNQLESLGRDKNQKTDNFFDVIKNKFPYLETPFNFNQDGYLYVKDMTKLFSSFGYGREAIWSDETNDR